MQKGIDFIGAAVIFFCHDGKGNFIMGKRSENARDEHGRWDIGGGGVEFGSTVEDTLEKEIMEEYCTKVLKKEFLGFRDVFREKDGRKTHWIVLDYKVLVEPGTVKNGEPHKMDEVKWFNRQTAPQTEMCHSEWGRFQEIYKNVLWN